MTHAGRSWVAVRRSRWAGPAVIFVLDVALGLAGTSALQALRYDRTEIAAGAWWRIVGCAWVHLNAWHLALNMAGLAALAALQPSALPPGLWLWRTVALTAGMCALLWWGAPAIGSYAGLSGPLYGQWLLCLWAPASGGDRLAAAALATLLAVTGAELLLGAPAGESRLIGGPVLPESHVAGLCAAVAYAVLARGAARLRCRG